MKNHVSRSIRSFSCSEGDLEKFAKRLLGSLKEGSIIFLSGEVGSGKTTLAHRLIQSKIGSSAGFLGSPTFPIMSRYRIPRSKQCILHFDLYRLSDEIEFFDRGLWEEFTAIPFEFAIFEWCENLPSIRQRLLQMKSGKSFEIKIGFGRKNGFRTYAVRGL